jgi:hypothetical protein
MSGTQVYDRTTELRVVPVVAIESIEAALLHVKPTGGKEMS